MNESNTGWDDLRLFLAVARAGGLSAAAPSTGKSAPTLGRRVQLLEKRLGMELFIRGASGYTLTAHGQQLLEQLGPIEDAIQPLMTSGTAPSLVVKVSAGSWMTRFLCRNTQDLLKNKPQLRLRFISAEHTLSISHRETLIGIRNQRPEHQALACRRLGKVRFAGYAAGKHLKPWIMVTGQTPSARWLLAQSECAAAVEISSPRNALDLARSGIGTALLPTFVGDAEKTLTRVTPDIAELTHDQWLVVHQEERRRPEVRATIDWIVSRIASLHDDPVSSRRSGKKP